MPAADDLPEDIRKVVQLQAVWLDPTAFEHSATGLLATIQASLSVAVDPDAASQRAGSSLLRIDLVDVYGQFVAEPAELLLRSQNVAHVARYTGVPTGRRIIVRGLADPPANHYVLDVITESFRPVRWMVDATPWKTESVATIPLPLEPTRVTGPRLPQFANLPGPVRTLMEHTSGSSLTYQTMGGTAQANLLNRRRRPLCAALEREDAG